MQASIIMTYHNEGILFVEETVRQIRETADIEEYEIIIVDDYSDTPIAVEGTTVLRHSRPMGMGAGFDTGVAVAKYDNLIIMGCDIRFVNNGWMSKMVASVEENHKSIICTQLVVLDGTKAGGLDFENRSKGHKMAGARLLPFHNKSNDPKKTEGYKSILACQWLPNKPNEKGTIVVPVVLGALYGIRKAWYNHFDGFAGIKIWGSGEPYISLKSWMFGGNCLCNKDIEVGHIFNRNPNHGIPQAAIYYNKMWCARVLFDHPISSNLINYLPKIKFVEAGKTWITEKYLDKKRVEYRAKTVVSMQELEILMKTSFTLPADAVHKDNVPRAKVPKVNKPKHTLAGRK